MCPESDYKPSKGVASLRANKRLIHCNKIGSFNGIVLVVPNLRQHLFGMSSRFRFSLSRFCGSISKRPNPDVALNHMRDLAVDHLTPKLGMIVRCAVEVEVLRIDRLP